ncbi:uncharacterized protein LOC131603604 isoform X1 [Vicia villosa]|uniref:uncharacterized protein LOC131603604 isoform X1 n=1 Tax=Vicia villosa TaxID=3911 RepID=UPI00273C961F|nr:uncharacterized protein LOC131603604 isoform X1 [Vicia villosa]
MGKSGETSGTKRNSKQETAEEANERPEWLPDGWNIEVRTRKSGPAVGSAYKCYVDPLNIHKFYSKPEVLRHLETTKDSNGSSKKKKGTDKHSTSKEEEKCIDKHSPNKKKQKRTNSNQHSLSKEEEKFTSIHSPNNTTEKANERPEWLPDGWDIQVQTRKSGPAKGSTYKCFIDPLNTHKFYSKPEVLRHLETTKASNCSSKKKKGTSKHSPSKEEEKCTDKHSPNKEEKCIDKHSLNKEKQKRTNNNQHSPSEEEEKCIDMHSPSKEEEEYINMDSGSKDGERFTSMHSPNNVAGEKSAEEDLPPGWIKEAKIRKNRNGIRKDWLYIDPASGYVFYSKKDVLRYIESGDINKCAIKPSRRQNQDEDNSTPTPAAKRQKPKQSTPRQKISAVKEPAESLELPDVNNLMKGQDVNVSSGRTVAPDTSGESLKVGHRGSRRLAGADPVKLADNVINNQTPIVPKRNLRKNRTTLAADMENKSSQHLNGVPEIEQPKAMNLRTTLSEDNKPESRTNSNKFSKKKEPHIPCRASKRLAGSESKRSKEVTAELQQGEGGPDHSPLNGESRNKRRKSPLVLPVADNQLETLEVDDEKSEPQLSFAFHYSWSDPCLDYAINTLTGVLPPVDNSVDNGPVLPPVDNSVDNGPCTAPETDIQKPTFDTGTGRSKDSQNNSVDNGSTTVHETDIQNQNNSVDNGPTTVHETDIQNQNNSVDNGPNTVHETDIQKTLIDNVTGGSKDSQSNNVTRGRDKNASVQSNKSKRKKEVKVPPMRLSKRLAGIEPEAKPSDKALEYSSKKSSKEESAATVLLTNVASDHLHAGEEAKLTRHASDSLKTEMLEKSSRKSGKSSDDQTVHKEQQLEKAEAENISDDRSKPEPTLPFSESWSDPCLEFAFKTLTGALPDDSAAEIFKVPSPGVGDGANNELHGRVTTSINGKIHDNPNPSPTKKEHNMAGQSSKPLLGQPELMTSSTSVKNMDGESSELLPRQPELRTSSTSDKNVPKFTNGEFQSHEGNIIRNLEPVLMTTTGESHSYESEMIRNLFGEPPFVEAENTTQLLDHSRTNAYSQIQEEPLKKNDQVAEPLKKNDQVAEGEFGTLDQPPGFETEPLKKNDQVAEGEFGTLDQPPGFETEPLKKNDQVAEGEFGTLDKPPGFETQTLNHNNTELQFCESFMNTWSDPCLEFAFKTLTGVLPVEENLGTQGGNQEPSNCHTGRDGISTLPDFGSSSFSQSDFSFHFDTGVKSTPGQPGQQSSVSSSFSSPSLQSCPGVDPQQQYSQFNNNFQRR